MKFLKGRLIMSVIEVAPHWGAWIEISNKTG